jgi:DNA-binding CsgD family transcriptional regulator
VVWLVNPLTFDRGGARRRLREAAWAGRATRRKYSAYAGRIEGGAPKFVVVARSSPYRIALSSEQERELARRAAAYSGPYRDVVRAKAILLAAEGRSNAEVAERLGVSRQSVSQWRKRFFDQGLDGLEEQPRIGRPGSFSPAADRGGQGVGVRASRGEGRLALTLVKR